MIEQAEYVTVGPSVSDLLAEQTGSRSHDRLDELADTFEDLRGVSDAFVKDNLAAILLTLVWRRQGHAETNGKALMDGLATTFGARLSPGTVYPCLHELAEEGILAVQERVRTKEYGIADPDAAAARIEREMHQHLALARLFAATLDDDY